MLGKLKQRAKELVAARVDIVCVTQIFGEYRINYISLLILSILQYLGTTLLEEVPRS